MCSINKTVTLIKPAGLYSCAVKAQAFDRGFIKVEHIAKLFINRFFANHFLQSILSLIHTT